MKALNRLAAAGPDLTPVMREIAAALEDAAQEAFEREQSPDGKSWTASGLPIPFGDIPARPFLGCSDDLDAEILDMPLNSTCGLLAVSWDAASHRTACTLRCSPSRS